jgi:serine/threonine protein kinase
MESPSNGAAVSRFNYGQQTLLGQVIADKYRIERLLGRGGMGAVYEGKHLLLDRAVAIKVMDGEVAEDKRAAARFLREAKAAAKIEHPHAVTIHDFGVWQDRLAYIVMEYIPGQSLREYLDQNRTLMPQEVVELLGQACEAVAAAHEQGIVHRDLKPENIMLKAGPDGKQTVKVVDFGLAKLLSGDGGSGSSHITKTGEVIGTPYYMAPEFYDGEEVDERADIYALGIIAYEMLAGRAPFTGTVEKIIAGHLFQEAAPITTINSAVSTALNEVIMSALKKKRDERIATAIAFARAMKNVAELSDIDAASANAPAIVNTSAIKPDAPQAPIISDAKGQTTLEWQEENVENRPQPLSLTAKIDRQTVSATDPVFQTHVVKPAKNRSQLFAWAFIAIILLLVFGPLRGFSYSLYSDLKNLLTASNKAKSSTKPTPGDTHAQPVVQPAALQPQTMQPQTTQPAVGAPEDQTGNSQLDNGADKSGSEKNGGNAEQHNADGEKKPESTAARSAAKSDRRAAAQSATNRVKNDKEVEKTPENKPKEEKRGLLNRIFGFGRHEKNK